MSLDYLECDTEICCAVYRVIAVSEPHDRSRIARANVYLLAADFDFECSVACDHIRDRYFGRLLFRIEYESRVAPFHFYYSRLDYVRRLYVYSACYRVVRVDCSVRFLYGSSYCFHRFACVLAALYLYVAVRKIFCLYRICHSGFRRLFFAVIHELRIRPFEDYWPRLDCYREVRINFLVIVRLAYTYVDYNFACVFGRQHYFLVRRDFLIIVRKRCFARALRFQRIRYRQVQLVSG